MKRHCRETNCTGKSVFSVRSKLECIYIYIYIYIYTHICTVSLINIEQISQEDGGGGSQIGTQLTAY